MTGAPTGISSGIGQASDVQQLTYTWDGFGNLSERQDVNQSLSETFQYDVMNRLTQSQVTNSAGSGASLALSYGPMGNITSKSDTGTYTYGDSAHPYAVTQITDGGGNPVYSASYDQNGNQIRRNGDALTWDVANQPTRIQSATGTSTFAYGPDDQRYWQSDADGTVTTTVGSLFEVVSTNGGATLQYRHKIIANGQIIALHTLTQDGTAHTHYLHYDHLGSVDAVTDDTGNVVQRMSFDAFGQRRDPGNWTNDLTPTQLSSLKDDTDRGYTDQEQLDNVGLVHLNGRVYDPQIGRFISADPVVPNPGYSQDFNRYSYVDNNPLAYIDPSGFDETGPNSGSGDSKCQFFANGSWYTMSWGTCPNSGKGGGNGAGDSSSGDSGNGSSPAPGVSLPDPIGASPTLPTVPDPVSSGLTAPTAPSAPYTDPFVDFACSGNCAGLQTGRSGMPSMPGFAGGGGHAVVGSVESDALPWTWPLPVLPSLSGILSDVLINPVTAVILGMAIPQSTAKNDYLNLNHYTSLANKIKIEGSGVIRSPLGPVGNIYFTPETYTNATQAAQALQITTPAGFYIVPLENIEPISWMGDVPNGTGQEVIVNHPVSIKGAVWVPIPP